MSFKQINSCDKTKAGICVLLAVFNEKYQTRRNSQKQEIQFYFN